MIERELYMNKIRPFIGKDIIKVITGIRRSGKSVMMGLIMKELEKQGVSTSNIINLNFEDMSNAPLQNPENLYDYIKERTEKNSGKTYIFLDEIQEVTNWEKAVNSVRATLLADIYLTGSNSRLLSGELATYLAGRYAQFTIYPFSYKEFLLSKNAADSPSMFKEYLLLGGMPFLASLSYKPEESAKYQRDLYASVLLRDIVQRNRLRDTELLERIIRYTLSNIGQMFSASSISKYLKSEGRKVANDTVLSYLNACCDAYLFYRFPRLDLIGKKILTVNEKYYVADHGLREAVYGNNIKDIGEVLENIVALELLRRGYKATVGKAKEQEIDFVAEKNNNRIYIQVAYLLADKSTVEREFKVYDKICDNFPKYVLSLDEFDFGQNGIRHENIRNFLLSDDW